jgi:hypothetical protein
MLAEAELEPAAGAPVMYAVRRLGEDDLSTLAALYPVAPLSTLVGRVMRAGAPVAGVRVMAIDAAGRVPHGALSAEDGGFRLPVAPGDYSLAAEPGDGPAAVAPEKVTVSEGASREGLELTLAAGAKLVVDSVGVVQSGFYAGMSRVDLARGRDHSLGITRSPLGQPVELLAPEPAIQRTGNATSPSSAPQLVRQPVKVAADAAVGGYGMIVRSGEVFSVLPAPIRIVVNPRIDAIKDAETGEPAATLRPGRRYVIRGSDLAPGEAAPAPEFEGAPAPAQVEGMAVRVGGRFVPLVSVKAEELMFDLPAGAVTEAGEAKVAVVAGTLMESAPVTVRLALE